MMARDYKPQGYSSVSVYMVVDSAQHVIDFLKQTFDSEQMRRFDRPAGSIMHAEIRIDDTIVMISESTAANKSYSSCLHVYVPDVDATYQRALAAGGSSIQEPTQKDDPDRRGGFTDPAGNAWWIATQTG